jgi:hypothetical protein
MDMSDVERVLGPRYGDIMRWAVGDDWGHIVISLVPARIRARIGMNIHDDDLIESSLFKIKDLWSNLGRRID